MTFPNWIPPERVALLAHRCNGPEEVAARATDADAVAVDVQELGDGSLVAHHLGFVEGAQGVSAWLRDLDLSHLRDLAPGIAAMSEVLIAVADHRVGLHLDVGATSLGALERLLSGLNGHGLGRATLVGSSRGEVVWSAAAAGWPTALAVRDPSADPVTAALDAGAAMVQADFEEDAGLEAVGGEWGRRARTAGLPVLSWNVTSRSTAEALLEVGVRVLRCQDPTVAPPATG